MGKYREKIEVIGIVLQKARQPSTKFQLYEASATSHNEFKKMHEALLDSDYLREISGNPKEYETTQRGIEFLIKINELKPHLERYRRHAKQS